MVEILAIIGQSVGAVAFSAIWILEEPECPKSLIK